MEIEIIISRESESERQSQRQRQTRRQRQRQRQRQIEGMYLEAQLDPTPVEDPLERPRGRDEVVGEEAAGQPM
jgi:hypothetical protein